MPTKLKGKMISLIEASKEVESLLRPQNWFIAVGTNESNIKPKLFLYVTSKQAFEQYKFDLIYQGYPIELRVIGEIQAIKGM